MKDVFRFLIYGSLVSIFMVSGLKIRQFNRAEIEPDRKARGLTIIPATGAYSQVTRAMELAKSGDIVFVPAGVWTWKGCVTIKPGVTLAGYGIHETTIRRGESVGTLIIVTSNVTVSNLAFTAQIQGINSFYEPLFDFALVAQQSHTNESEGDLSPDMPFKSESVYTEKPNNRSINLPIEESHYHRYRSTESKNIRR